MKAIPFICSRTKNKDFISSYLVRPDFEWSKIRAIVSDAMYDLNTLDDLRYAVFSADNYCFMGVGCLSSYLVNRIGYEVAAEYLKDRVGRSLACFIGFAVPVASEDKKTVPDIVSDDFLRICCETYFKHLQKQWNNEDEVTSEVISLDSEECVELPEKEITDVNIFEPSDMTDSKKGIKVTSCLKMEYFYYYLDKMINKHEENFNFINHIDFEDQWQRLQFKNASVSNEFMNNLPIIEKREEEKITTAIISSMKQLYNSFKINGNNLEKENEENRKQLNTLQQLIEKGLNAQSLSEVETYIKQYNSVISSIQIPDIEKFKNDFEDLKKDEKQILNNECKKRIKEFSDVFEKMIDDFENNRDTLSQYKINEKEMNKIAESFKKLDEYKLRSNQIDYNKLEIIEKEWGQLYSDIDTISSDNNYIIEQKSKLLGKIVNDFNEAKRQLRERKLKEQQSYRNSQQQHTQEDTKCKSNIYNNYQSYEDYDNSSPYFEEDDINKKSNQKKMGPFQKLGKCADDFFGFGGR